MIRIFIYVHFNKNNSLEDNVIDYLKTIKELVEEIFFIMSNLGAVLFSFSISFRYDADTPILEASAL